MSSQCPFFSQDVAFSDDMDAWFCMLNSMVNFLSAASTLATKLEQNYLLSNVTELKRPAFPLLCAPPTYKKIEQPHNIDTDVKNSTDDIYSLFMEQISASSSQPESECQGETGELLQEVRYMDTKDKGDGSSSDSREEEEIEEEIQSVVNDDQDAISFEEQEIETIKICDSEDTVYFDDYNESDGTVDHQKPPHQVTEVKDINQTTTIEKDESFSTTSSFVENKSVQAKCNSDILSKSSKNKIKSIKSTEIQTNSTSRFKSTVRALITKSPELQQSIKESIVCRGLDTTEKSPGISKEKTCCKRSAVPKNLNELKEQLDSIKNASSSKVILTESKGRCAKSKIPVDKSVVRRCRKTEKQPPSSTDTSSPSSNVPLKCPGTSKRFASVESVVKKLIHSKIPEKNTDEPKDHPKRCTSVQRSIIKHEKPEGSKQSVTKAPTEQEKKGHLPKDCKIVKDFIYKKPSTNKSEKSNDQIRPCTKKESCRKQSELLTQNQSKMTSQKSAKNSPTMEILKKKEKCCKRAASPNKVVKGKEDVKCVPNN